MPKMMQCGRVLRGDVVSRARSWNMMRAMRMRVMGARVTASERSDRTVHFSQHAARCWHDPFRRTRHQRAHLFFGVAVCARHEYPRLLRLVVLWPRRRRRMYEKSRCYSAASDMPMGKRCFGGQSKPRGQSPWEKQQRCHRMREGIESGDF